MIFNKDKIKSNFNRFSNNYQNLASLQQLVALELFNISKESIINSKAILDLGCGSGFLGQNIQKNNLLQEKDLYQLDLAINMFDSQLSSANIHNINADIENLPFKRECFDLVVSSLAFQWLNNLKASFGGIKRILKPESPLIFSTFVEGTLGELKESVLGANINLSVNNFINLSDLTDIIQNNFTKVEIKVKNHKVLYPDIFSILHAIKDIGASYSANIAGKNSLKRKDFEDLALFYLKKFNDNGRLIVSWNVAYVVAIN